MHTPGQLTPRYVAEQVCGQQAPLDVLAVEARRTPVFRLTEMPAVSGVDRAPVSSR